MLAATTHSVFYKVNPDIFIGYENTTSDCSTSELQEGSQDCADELTLKRKHDKMDKDVKETEVHEVFDYLALFKQYSLVEENRVYYHVMHYLQYKNLEFDFGTIHLSNYTTFYTDCTADEFYSKNFPKYHSMLDQRNFLVYIFWFMSARVK